MKRKVKRFNGENDSYVETSNNDVEDILADAREEYEIRQAAMQRNVRQGSEDEDGGTTAEFKRSPKLGGEKSETATGSTPSSKKTSFSSAFAAARAKALRGGPKTFEWEGKTYGTALKGETSPKKAELSKTQGLGMAGSDMGSKKPATREKEEKRSGVGGALAATGMALGSAALLKAMRKSGQDRREGDLERAAREREGRAKSGTSLRMPGSRMDKNDPYSMTLGSDLDPKSMMKNRLSGDIDYKKGGKVSSASSRADGIAQRGKTRGKLR